jgi:hypothetical protein
MIQRKAADFSIPVYVPLSNTRKAILSCLQQTPALAALVDDRIDDGELDESFVCELRAAKESDAHKIFLAVRTNPDVRGLVLTQKRHTVDGLGANIVIPYDEITSSRMFPLTAALQAIRNHLLLAQGKDWKADFKPPHI